MSANYFLFVIILCFHSNEGVGIVMIAESKSLGGEGFKEHFTQTYRSHYIAEEVEVPGGAYYITPTTFNPNKEGAFVLTVSTDCVMPHL